MMVAAGRAFATVAATIAATVAIYGRMMVLALLGRPYKLTLLLSGSCNLRCQICSIWRAPARFIALSEVQEIWNAFRWKPCWINISGGEPTLHPQLEEILALFLSMKRSLLVTVTTNGYRDPVPMLERVLRKRRRGLLYVSVSLDGEAAEHNAARGRGDAFARTMQSYRGLRALQQRLPALRVGISVTVSRVNHDRVLPFIRRCLQENDAVSINLAQSSAYYHNTDIDRYDRLPKQETAELLRQVQLLLPLASPDAFLKTLFLDAAVRRLEGKPVSLPCSSMVSNVLVTADLDLMNCTLLFQPWGPGGASRSAKLQTITQAIRQPSTRTRLLRKQVRHAGCESRCQTPCENYVHAISALSSPRRAPGLLWRYFLARWQAQATRRCLHRPAAATGGMQAEPERLTAAR